jgi:hypothetical protein
MGVGFVLIFWAIAGIVFASLIGAILAASTARFTRNAKVGRRLTILAAGFLPFGCLAWAGALFIFQAFVNEGLLHRDLGIGDGWHCPVTNGYEIAMIDVTDQGWVYNRATQSFENSLTEREDSVGGVRLLHVSGRYILGAADTHAFEHLDQSESPVDTYFILDTRTGKRSNFQSASALSAAAARLGIAPNLRPINEVYSEYRFTWFDVFVGILFIAPPLIAVGFLLRRIIRLREQEACSVPSR